MAFPPNFGQNLTLNVISVFLQELVISCKTGCSDRKRVFYLAGSFDKKRWKLKPAIYALYTETASQFILIFDRKTKILFSLTISVLRPGFTKVIPNMSSTELPMGRPKKKSVLSNGRPLSAYAQHITHDHVTTILRRPKPWQRTYVQSNPLNGSPDNDSIRLLVQVLVVPILMLA